MESLLETFSKSEQEQFLSFLRSPFFNENEDLVHLFEVLKPYLNNAAAESDKKVIWKELFPGKKFDDAKLRLLCSKMTYLAFDFLKTARQSSLSSQQLDLLKILRQRKLDKHSSSLLKKMQAEISDSTLQDKSHHLLQFETHQFIFQQAEEKSKTDAGDVKMLEKADFHLDCFFFSQKLKNFCDLLDYTKSRTTSTTIYFPDSLLELIEQGGYLQEPAVKAYYLVLNLLQKPEEEQHFHALKAMLAESKPYFEPKELRALYLYLMNYCIDSKINKGFSRYFEELFQIYQLTIQEEILLDHDILPVQDYKNIITVGLQVKAFAWVEAFIQTYTEKLQPEHQENALAYNLAKVYFHQEQYEKVIEQLREVEYSNLIYALGGKLLLLRTYFETGEYLALDSLIDSFRIYLHRNQQISREVRQQYLNLLRYIKKISNLPPGDKSVLLKIKQQVQDCKSMAAKGWVLEKVEELM
ncbi:MAG TPA: hypothetical protein PKA00_16510 [Saprospiraceae bacterium]|nr:hypothetical protein [Saprospiraceae bacterium]HMQ84519.1 hypothetical protein [Saprospiraceae bacterium]